MTSPSAPGSQWIRRFHPSADGTPRVICFPHAGGSASYFFQLSRLLAPATEVLAVQYPGRQDRRAEPCIDDIHALADGVAQALGTLDDRPFVFFGHSMGALVAYEVAVRLERQGRPEPARMIVSGRRAPSRSRRGEIHLRDDVGFIADLVRLGGTDQRLLADPEMRALALPTARSDYRAVETYVHRPAAPLRCPITALVGDQDPEAPIGDVRAWSRHTASGLTLRVFAGGHFYLDDAREQVAQVILEAVDAFATTGTAVAGESR